MPAVISRKIFYTVTESMDGKREPWLQITAITNIGNPESEPKQKILRLSVEDCKEFQKEVSAFIEAAEA